MKSIRILMYKGDHHALDNVIDNYTWFWRWLWCKNCPKELRSAHAEIEFPYHGDAYECQDDAGNWLQLGDCFTSTMRDEVDGVVMRPASEVLTHPSRWNYFEIALTDSEYTQLYDYCKKRASMGIKYGKLTIASFFLPFRINEKSRDICSEAVCAALVKSLGPLPEYYNKVYDLWDKLDDLNVPSPLRLAWNIWSCGYDLYDLESGKIILTGKQ